MRFALYHEGMILAVSLSVPILIAVVGGLMTLATALGGLAGFNAYKSAASGWREERNAAVAKANRLEQDVEDMKARMAAMEKEIEILRQKDVSKLYDLMNEHHQTMMEVAAKIQERDIALIDICKTLSAKL